jgi:tetratricopeptide (TPR) repeat protein
VLIKAGFASPGPSTLTTFVGFSSDVLNDLSATDLECVINVYVALAKCLANVHKPAESVAAYQNALRVSQTSIYVYFGINLINENLFPLCLQILQGSKASDDMSDRSILFPIFNGLFAALQFGQIGQDEQCTYEQSLVARFVYETRVHGDPVHYTRALAMQCEMYGRLGQYEKALEMHTQLAELYNAEEHSSQICEFYGCDRSAQSFSLSALWYAQTGDTTKALETCWYVLNELFPEMERSNVHNSCLLIYPVLWILKDNNFALDARDHFIRWVVEPFDEYFGDGRSTFCLPVYDPIMMVLDLAGNPEVENLADYLDWATTDDNLRYGTVINCALGSYGHFADAISAEICLLLANLTQVHDEKCYLIGNALEVLDEVISLAEVKKMLIAGKRCRELHAKLVEMAKEL